MSPTAYTCSGRAEAAGEVGQGWFLIDSQRAYFNQGEFRLEWVISTSEDNCRASRSR